MTKTPWGSSDRATRLPRDWKARRARVLARCGYKCEWQDPSVSGARCPNRATECDHIARGDDHSLDNLQGLCGPHHAAKTQREAAEARRLRGRMRPREVHPAFRRVNPGG